MMKLHRGGFFFDLPSDLVAHCLSFCDASSLFQVAVCSRATNRAYLDATPVLHMSYTVEGEEFPREAYTYLSKFRSCSVTIPQLIDARQLRVPPNTISLSTVCTRGLVPVMCRWPADVSLPPRLSSLSVEQCRLPPLHHLPLRSSILEHQVEPSLVT